MTVSRNLKLLAINNGPDFLFGDFGKVIIRIINFYPSLRAREANAEARSPR
jgi:hypothetical protein